MGEIDGHLAEGASTLKFDPRPTGLAAAFRARANVLAAARSLIPADPGFLSALGGQLVGRQ